MKITINKTDYTVSESATKWTLSNTSGKMTASFVVSKSEAPTLKDLVKYVRCIKIE